MWIFIIFLILFDTWLNLILFLCILPLEIILTCYIHGHKKSTLWIQWTWVHELIHEMNHTWNVQKTMTAFGKCLINTAQEDFEWQATRLPVSSFFLFSQAHTPVCRLSEAETCNNYNTTIDVVALSSTFFYLLLIT